MNVSASYKRYSRFIFVWLASSLLLGCAQTTMMVRDEQSGEGQVAALIEESPEANYGVEGTEKIEVENLVDTDSPFFAENSENQKTIVSLSFEKTEANDNMVIAELSEKTEIETEQTAPSEFVVRIKGATFDDAAVGNILDQEKTNSIRSVRPTKDGNDTILRIFADPEKVLSAEVKEKRLVVKAETPIFVDEEEVASIPTEEIRAQAEEAGVSVNPSGVGTRDVDDIAKLLDSTPKYTGRLISLDLQDTDIDNALRIIAEVSNLNIIASEDVQGKVTLRLIDVPWDQALDVILKTNGLDKVQEGNVVRIAPVEKLRSEREALKQAQQAEEELEPLQVKFIRVSYAKSADLKPLIDNVLSERGASSFDERTNQLIIKDISRGIKNVVQLVSKLDLRTPQILLETQIVEAQRTLLRDLGSEVGFQYIQSPATGNPTGKNFPNSVDFSGAISNAAANGANPISLLFGSADGSQSLAARITSLESEGRVRIISKPAVATTNNKQAVIKSVEKIRIRLPSGGVSVATGQGASAAGQGQTATETIEIGILLEVTPQASPDYYVLLDINAKSSTLGANEVDGVPSEVERSATSSVLVSSGQTFALGGIYKITDDEGLDGVPFFKDIPIVGTFFRRNLIQNSDEELLFFLTPRIVEGSFDDSTMRASS
jgi:type IV pilus secretin PilQ/predicted competence protein